MSRLVSLPSAHTIQFPVCHISHPEMVFELPRQIRRNSYFEVPIYTSQFSPYKACNCSQKYYVVVATENGTTYYFTITLLKSCENVQKVRYFQTQQSFTQHALCCKARDLEFWEAVGRVPFDQRKFRKKGLYLSVRVFSTVVLIVDTVNKQTNITNRTEIC